MMHHAIETPEEYLRQITGRAGHFTCLTNENRRIAVFRRLSFIPPDDLTMIRLRLEDDVTPKVRSSVLNGFLIGEVRVDAKGRLIQGLDVNHRALLDYLLKEPMGAYVVEKLDQRLFKVHYPGDFLEVLIGRAVQMMKTSPITTIRNHRWLIRVGNIRFEVERFLESCRVQATLKQFCDLLKVKGENQERFVQLYRPCILAAFGRTVDVAGTMCDAVEKQNQLSDRALMHLFHTYEPMPMEEWFPKLMIPLPAGKAVKPTFLAGRRLQLSPRWALPEMTTLPISRIAIPKVNQRNKKTDDHFKLAFHIPSCRGKALFRTIAHQQYKYLRGCLTSRPVEFRLNGQRLVGRVSAVDQTIYTPIWSIDHFFNCLAMIDFDLPLARSMILGGLIDFMTLKGVHKGKIAFRRKNDQDSNAYPIWAPVIQRFFARTDDRKFLKQVWPLLLWNDHYLDRFCQRDGLYMGAGESWNDYSAGPKALPFVSGIGLNSLIALQKKILFELSAEMGTPEERLGKDYEKLKAQINDRFWDDRLGFYFDYDYDRQEIYTTARGGRFFGLDNLLPLFAGIVPEDRVESMARYLTSSWYYGRYPAITTDLSDDFMDERRLMVWVMTQWLVIQGLRSYRLHAIADGIARRIFNAFLEIWDKHRSLPEALSGTFGLAPMENRTLAGVGGWAGFYLYLQEALQGSDSHRYKE